MASIIDLKKQISGIRNTRKITKSMQLVAASKMKQFQDRAVAMRKFAFDMLAILASHKQTLVGSEYLAERETGKTVFVLYSTDRGLCGPLNQQIFRHLVRSTEWNETPEAERLLVTIGKKGEDLARVNGIKNDLTLSDVPESLTVHAALSVIDKLLLMWEREDVKKIYMVVPHYKNSFTYIPLTKQFLPVSDSVLEAHIGVHPESFTEEVSMRAEGESFFEPGKEELTVQLTDKLVRSLFLQAVYELRASEFSSRMLAMQSATDAADKILDSKTLEFNKLRQQKITQEIAEITGARAALA
jgi:F-type H+-transporting ATPase subunit gamma